jgi:6-pyruvoyltetrahydropterin/6-carboxytetrahydropterin synthase
VFDLTVEHTISAGHQLREYHGKCERCHGHNWRIRLEITVAELDPIGLGVDFNALKALLSEAVAGYDHVMLNELPEFGAQNPTSENLARNIYRACREKLKVLNPAAAVKGVTVWESPGAGARYHE